MFNKLKQLSFQKKLKTAIQDSLQVNRKKINIEQIKTVGVLFDASSEYTFTQIEHFIDRYKFPKVQYLGYLNTTKKKLGIKEIPFPYFTNDDVAFNLTANGSIVKDFTKQNFDLLLYLNTQKNETLSYIMATSQAHFRVGKYFASQENLFELMINIPEDAKLEELCKQISTNLKMFEKR